MYNFVGGSLLKFFFMQLQTEMKKSCLVNHILKWGIYISYSRQVIYLFQMFDNGGLSNSKIIFYYVTS